MAEYNHYTSLLSPEARDIYKLFEEFEVNLLQRLDVFDNTNPDTAESKTIEQLLKQKLNRLLSTSHFSTPSMRRGKNSWHGFVSDKYDEVAKTVQFEPANCTDPINQFNRSSPPQIQKFIGNQETQIQVRYPFSRSKESLPSWWDVKEA